tara:strand:- start:2411 stop:3103 length:693 start_codon:yes stop_codon:yes gene_type:complete
MSQNRLPEISDPLKHITDLSIRPDIKPEENVQMEIETIVNVVPEQKVDSKSVFGKEFPKKTEEDGITKDEMVNDGPELPASPKAVKRGQGKRGKDKKKRAKKVMTESQLAALAAGRKRSLEKRQAKAKAKSNPIPIPTPTIAKPRPAEKLDYSTFSNYMDMYEETKKKKNYSKNSEPHPNKIINERHRPAPPRSQPRIAPKPKKALKWTGNITAYQTHKKSVNSRWNYGI